MDFTATLNALAAAFEAAGVRYALAGGVALAALGAGRATRDIDFLVDRRDLPAADEVMARLGYKASFHSENFTHYRHADVPAACVDFQHAFRTVSLGMLARALVRPLGPGAKPVRVLQPEDLIGLKIQAFANNPERKRKDEADIEALMERHGPRLDWGRVAEYFQLFGLGPELAELRRRFERAE